MNHQLAIVAWSKPASDGLSRDFVISIPRNVPNDSFFCLLAVSISSGTWPFGGLGFESWLLASNSRCSIEAEIIGTRLLRPLLSI
jgi:hypothetical protein